MTRRKPRPLTREQSDYRDDRLFIVATDDTHAPKQYFEFFRLHKIKIHVVPTLDGRCSSEHVLERLCELDHQEHDERWILLDTDHYVNGAHIKSFRNTLRSAAQRGVKVALSRPCFEVWLLLHHVEELAASNLQDARETAAALRVAINGYNKTGLKRAHFTEDGVIQACRRAFRLDTSVKGGAIPVSATTRVHKLWREILDAVPNHMLSIGLRDLRMLESWR